MSTFLVFALKIFILFTWYVFVDITFSLRTFQKTYVQMYFWTVNKFGIFGDFPVNYQILQCVSSFLEPKLSWKSAKSFFNSKLSSKLRKACRRFYLFFLSYSLSSGSEKELWCQLISWLKKISKKCQISFAFMIIFCMLDLRSE